jgi:hypothetical protein
MNFDSESPEVQEPRLSLGARPKPWISFVSAAVLVSASTFVLLLCPCDRPSGSWAAILLVALSGLFALAAALVLYLRLRKDPGATAFISAFKAAGIVALAVYAELRIGVLIVEWMARIR